MLYPTLYKRTKTGKVQIWFMEQDGDKYRTTSGQQDGKKVTSEWTVAKAKNVGRTNATTAEEQAAEEIRQSYTKQLKSKYFENIEDIDNEQFFAPMLCAKWQDVVHKIKDPFVDIQPKLDGMRCLAKRDGLFTRGGERWVTPVRIFELLQETFDLYPDLVIDGELYNHEFKDDFNKLASLIKKTKPKQEDIDKTSHFIQYWIYDVYHPDMSWSDRKSLINDIIGIGSHPLIKTPTARVALEEVDRAAFEYIEQGYEGAIVRLDWGTYEKDRRSKNLLKWKTFQDSEFRIISINEGNGNRSGMVGNVTLALPNGNTFNAGMIGNETYLKWLLENKTKYLGKMGTVVYQNLTPDGVPRFPKFKTVRDYE